MFNTEKQIISITDGEPSLTTQTQLIPYPHAENNLSQEEKIQIIEHHFEQILLTLGMNLEDDSLKKTPHRYAKMLVSELLEGLDPQNFPTITSQENKFHYNEMVIESQISIKSICEHHFVPVLGFCHIAYIPKEKIIGLSKLDRIAQFFAKRPQVQERLTRQIRESLVEILETEDVAVVVDALHLCVRMRGVEDHGALTRTIDTGGAFKQELVRNEFLTALPKLSDLKII